jgi:hypothetical protein
VADAAHNAKIHRSQTPIGQHKQIPRMHVGVEKSIAEHLHEKRPRRFFHRGIKVDAGFFHALHIAGGKTHDPFQGHDAPCGQRPFNARNIKIGIVFAVGAQLVGSGGFKPQIGFNLHGLGEGFDHCHGFKPPIMRQAFLDDLRQP